MGEEGRDGVVTIQMMRKKSEKGRRRFEELIGESRRAAATNETYDGFACVIFEEKEFYIRFIVFSYMLNSFHLVLRCGEK